MRWLAAPLALLVLAGCGGDDSSEEASSPTTSTLETGPVEATAPEPEPESGPLVRICDRALAAQVRDVLAAQRYRGRLGQPIGTGSAGLSQCELEVPEGEVVFSLDVAQDAVRRYRIRITETAQFSGGEPDQAPHPVGVVGDRNLQGAGANWIPASHSLHSVRGNRWLTVSVTAPRVSDPRSKDAAVALSLYVYERLGSP
jgi:hypothetical protein